MNLKSKRGQFSRETIWFTTTRALPWWKGFCNMSLLYPIAARLFSVSPTSAACESNFSMWSFTHTKLRNRLLLDRVGKLVYIRHNLSLLKPKPTVMGKGFLKRSSSAVSGPESSTSAEVIAISDDEQELDNPDTISQQHRRKFQT